MQWFHFSYCVYVYSGVGKFHTVLYEGPFFPGGIEVVSERFAEIKYLEKASMPKGSTLKSSKAEDVHGCPLCDVMGKINVPQLCPCRSTRPIIFEFPELSHIWRK